MRLTLSCNNANTLPSIIDSTAIAAINVKITSPLSNCDSKAVLSMILGAKKAPQKRRPVRYLAPRRTRKVH